MDNLDGPAEGPPAAGTDSSGSQATPTPHAAAAAPVHASRMGAVLVPTAPTPGPQACMAREQAPREGVGSAPPDCDAPAWHGGDLGTRGPPSQAADSAGHDLASQAAASELSGAVDPSVRRAPTDTSPPTDGPGAPVGLATASSDSAATPLVAPKPALDSAASAASPVDRRTALAAHLARQAAPALSRREAALQRSMRDLQRQCTELGRTMAEAQARQGPLVQRLQAAQTRLGGLAAAPATAGSAAVQAMQAMLSQALHIQRNMPSL